MSEAAPVAAIVAATGTADGTALRLPAELTIYTAAETRAAWLGWLSDDAVAWATAGSTLPVQAADVAEVDGAGLQLLVALHHSLAQMRLGLALQQPSATLQAACADLGLHGLLLGAAPDRPASGVAA